MSNYTHASIVPLVGGETLAMEAAFGKKPEYMLSYPPFANNDQHIVAHYGESVPYHVIAEGTDLSELEHVDVVSTVCPCAGLSSLSVSANSDAAANDWMYTTAEHVLGTMQPKVFWGENSPNLAGKWGKPVVAKLRKIADAHGYTFSIYRTRSLMHGLPQIRNRVFYFFWKDDKIPVLNWFDRPLETFTELVTGVERRDDDVMNVLMQDKIPSEDPWYRYILEELHGGITHKEFREKHLKKSTCVYLYIESMVDSYLDLIPFFEANDFPKEAAACVRQAKKLAAGGNIMRRGIDLPKDFGGAFVGHLPMWTAHPTEDRFLTLRECASLMKLPEDFIIQGGKKNANHICQNVPVSTATDVAGEIVRYLNGELDSIDASYVIQYNTKKEFYIDREDASLAAFL